jgi:hypothetical protein
MPIFPAFPIGGGGAGRNSRYGVKNKTQWKNIFFSSQQSYPNQTKPLAAFKQPKQKTFSQPKNNNFFNIFH